MYEVPEPKKFAPDISPEQLKAMQPIDKLVQYVVPRLIDKVNYLSWKVDKLEHESAEALSSMGRKLMDAEPATLDKTITTDIYKSLNEIHEWQHAVDNNIAKLIEAMPAKRRAPQRKKAETQAAPAYVADGAYSMYDPDKDNWVPYEFDGVKVTASAVRAVIDDPDCTTGWCYPEDLIKFVNNLSDAERAALCKRFPE